MPRPARPWFRLYSDLLDNLKVEKLTDRQFRRWMKLLALANVNEPRGRLPDMEKIAFRLRVNVNVAAGTIEELVALKFLDAEGDTFVLHDWDDWQKDSDARATEGRQKRGDSAAVAPQNGRIIAAVAPPRVEESREDKEKEEKKKEIRPDPVLLVESTNIYRETERCLGRGLTAAECEKLRELEDTFPEETWRYALREASDLDKRNLRYIQRVCENHATGVSNATKPVGRNSGAAQTAGDPAAEAARIYASMGIRNLPVFLGPDG